MWPVRSAFERGATLTNARNFFARLDYATFAKLADEQFKFGQLTPGGAVWVPYGWQPIALAVPSGQTGQHLLAEDEYASMYVQSFFAATLVSSASYFCECATT